MQIKVESFKIKDWEEIQTGIVLAENENWILVNHIPVDYLIDGYNLINKKHILKRHSGKDEQQIERVTKLKGVTIEKPADFLFADALGLLKWTEDKFGLFAFQTEDEYAAFFGKINRVEKDVLIIDSVFADGTVVPDYDFEFDLNEIRTITFGSDYFESMRLLWLDENK
jgi:hypothetical protein